MPRDKVKDHVDAWRRTLRKTEAMNYLITENTKDINRLPSEP
jgi:hypothetical protein